MAISFVRQNGFAINTGSASSQLLTFTTAPTAGNLVICVARSASGVTPLTATDSLGNSWTRDVFTSSTACNVAIFSWAATGSPTTVNITYSGGGSSGNRTVYVAEFSGAMLLNSRLGNTAIGSSGGNATTGSITTPSTVGAPLRGALIIGAVGTGAQPTTSYSQSSPTGQTVLYGLTAAASMSYGIAPDTTARTHTWSWGTTSTTWAVAAAMYRATPVGGMFATLEA